MKFRSTPTQVMFRLQPLVFTGFEPSRTEISSFLYAR